MVEIGYASIEKLHRSGILVAIIATIFHIKLHRSDTSSGIKSIYHPAGAFGVIGLLISLQRFRPAGPFLFKFLG